MFTSPMIHKYLQWESGSGKSFRTQSLSILQPQCALSSAFTPMHGALFYRWLLQFWASLFPSQTLEGDVGEEKVLPWGAFLSWLSFLSVEENLSLTVPRRLLAPCLLCILGQYTSHYKEDWKSRHAAKRNGRSVLVLFSPDASLRLDTCGLDG